MACHLCEQVIISLSQVALCNLATNGPCESQNLGRIVCVAEVHLSRKPLFDLVWVVTGSKRAMNLIMTMNLIKKQLDTVSYIGTGHESHYRFVETNSGQLSILSPYLTLSDCCGQQSPHEYH